MAAAVLTSSVFFTACNDDDDDNPTPTEQTSDNTNNGGTGTTGGTTNNGGGTTNGGTTNGGTTGDNGGNTVTTADYSNVKCLNGSDYYVILLNEQAYNYLEANNKIAGDLRANDSETFLDVWQDWGGHYSFGSLSGKDCFDYDSDGGITVTGDGDWCGGGWRRVSAFDFSKIDASYTLHIAVRASKSNKEWYMSFPSTSLNGKEFKITPDVEDEDGNAFDLNTKGQWKEFEFSVGDMIDAGVEFVNFDGSKASNIAAFGGFLGITVDIDAIFIYKK